MPRSGVARDRGGRRGARWPPTSAPPASWRRRWRSAWRRSSLLGVDRGRGRRAARAWPSPSVPSRSRLRLAACRAAAPTLATAARRATGRGRCVVETVGSPRDGQQIGDAAHAGRRSSRRSASRPPCPATRPSMPGDRVEVEGSIRAPPGSARTGAYLERIGAVGHAPTHATTRRAGRPTTPARRSRPPTRSPADALARVLPEPEAGLAAGDPDRPARPGRPRPRRRLHDGRREPRRRDLRLEHRDRRRRDRGCRRPARAATPLGRHDRRDRRVRRVRRGVAVGRSRRR